MTVAEATQLKGFQNPRKLGELVAKVGLEDRVIGTERNSDRRIIKNPALSQQRLATKAEFLQGLVDGMLAKGKWKKVVDLIFRKSSLSELYDGDTSELLQRIKEVVKPTDFSIDRRGDSEDVETISLLLQNGGEQVVYELALRSDFDHRVSETLLFRVKEGIEEEKYKAGLKTIAVRVQKEHPSEAVRLFEAAQDYQSIGALYETLMTDFSLDNLSLLLGIVKDKEWKIWKHDGVDRLKAIIEKALHAECRDQHKDLGKYLFNLLLDRDVALNDKDKAELRRLTVLSLDRYDFNPERKISTRFGEKRQPYKDLELDWAKAHWQEEPIFSYELFLANKYNGKEVIDCAEKAFRTMHEQGKHYSPNQEKADISLDHLAQLSTRLKPKEIELRQAVAFRIKYTLDGKENLDERLKATLESARKELRTLSLEYKAQGNNEESYRLWFEGNGSDDDQTIQDVREQLINKTITEIEREEKEGNRFYSSKFRWLANNDQAGYNLVCERLILNRTYLVYLLAEEKKDEATMAKARDLLLARLTPDKALHIFISYDGKVTDTEGYDRTIDLLTKQHGVPRDDFITLFGREVKQEE